MLVDAKDRAVLDEEEGELIVNQQQIQQDKQEQHKQLIDLDEILGGEITQEPQPKQDNLIDNLIDIFATSS